LIGGLAGGVFWHCVPGLVALIRLRDSARACKPDLAE
jgi:hypothetical protein